MRATYEQKINHIYSKIVYSLATDYEVEMHQMVNIYIF